jgi:hypothetical protein
MHILTDYKNKQKRNIKLQIRKHVQQIRHHLSIQFGLQNQEISAYTTPHSIMENKTINKNFMSSLITIMTIHRTLTGANSAITVNLCIH